MEEIMNIQHLQNHQPLDLLMVAQEAEKRIDAIRKIKSIALRVTNHADWVDQQGKPYLISSGAEKVARLFGIWWGGMKYEKEEGEDGRGKYYIYSCIGSFSLKGDTIEAIGTCSSRDPFFAKAGGEWKPIEEVDEPNIKKSAYSNCIVNGITRILGIRNLTWEEISAAGITKELVSKVEYGKGSQGGNTSTADDAKKQQELWAMLLEACDNNPNTAAAKLEELTAFTATDGKQVKGVKMIKSLRDKRLNIAHNKVKEYHAQWVKYVEDCKAAEAGGETK